MNYLPYTNVEFFDAAITVSENVELTNVPETVRTQLTAKLKRHQNLNGTMKKIQFLLDSNFNTNKEAYLLEIGADSARITASAENGLFWGAQTLMRCLEETHLQQLKIHDRPNVSQRGFKLYLPSPDSKGMKEFKSLIDFLVRFKYNFVMIEIGGAMEFKRHPEINEGWIEYCTFMNEYSGKPLEIQHEYPWRKNSIHSTNGGGKVVPQSMVKEMIDYCHKNFMDVVPEMPSLSHCDYLLTRHHELAERPDDPYPDAACPNHPDYYNLLFDLYEEIIAVFQPVRMHIGHDEYYSFGICPRCKGKKAYRIYADDINKCYAFLKTKNVDTMIWGDKLLNAHFPNGIGCGGAEINCDEEHNLERIEATYKAIDMIPHDLQIMHWYWSIDRDLENEFHRRGMPVILGNLSLRNLPDWKKRSNCEKIIGICVSNWGNTDFRTLQRNAMFFDIASTSAWCWNSKLDSDDYQAVRDWTLEELYFVRRQLQNSNSIEIVHTCDIKQKFKFFFDGWFVDEKKDTIGYHIFEDSNHRLFRFPVIYGSNISGSDVSFERNPIKKVGFNYDAYSVDMRLLEVTCETLPFRHSNKTFYRCHYNVPPDVNFLKYIRFEPVKDFHGNVESELPKNYLQINFSK